MDWIPVTKSYPEMRGNFLVTTRIKSKTDPELDFKLVMIDHYNGDGKWSENNSRYRTVIAWMPLPDKYEENER